MDPVVIVSPHFDDAVLSCGQLMAGRPDTVVVTVFGGTPRDTSLRPYDRLCGFVDAAQAMRARRAEDERAVRELGGSTVHLEFVDDQYGEPNDFVDLVEQLSGVVASVSPEYVLAPVGLAHPDHQEVTRAAFGAVEWRRLRFYEELPARVLWPELVPSQLEQLVGYYAEWPVRLERAYLGTGPLERKVHAAREYVSQRAVLGALEDGAGWHAVQCPERFWKVTADE